MLSLNKKEDNMNVHHIGYLVKSVSKAQSAFETLGYTVSKECIMDETRQAYIAFMTLDASCVELISPVNESSPLFPLLKKYKNMPYHLCFSTKDLEQELLHLTQCGWTVITPSAVAPAIDNKQVVFLMNRHIGIMELVGER